MMVGCAKIEFDGFYTPLGQKNDSWVYWSYSGESYARHGGSSPNYGETFASGDKITVILDFGKKTIEFMKNDKSLGVAHKNLNGKVKPAVSLLNSGDSVRIGNLRAL